MLLDRLLHDAGCDVDVHSADDIVEQVDIALRVDGTRELDSILLPA